MLNLIVRIVAGVVPLVTGAVMVHAISSWGGDDHEAQTNRFVGWMLAFVFLGLPAGYVAVKGIDFSRAGAANRRKGLRYILGGLGAIVLGAIVIAVATAGGSTPGMGAIFIPVALFGAGLISIIAGLVAIVTGQDMGNALESRRRRR